MGISFLAGERRRHRRKYNPRQPRRSGQPEQAGSAI